MVLHKRDTTSLWTQLNGALCWITETGDLQPFTYSATPILIAPADTWELKCSGKNPEKGSWLLSFYLFSTVIWCSKEENSLNCLSHEMDIWQSKCVTTAICGTGCIRSYISDYQDRKLEINNLIDWFGKKKLKYMHLKANQTATHCTIKMSPLPF